MKNTFSPRMKIGQPPASSGIQGSGQLNTNMANNNSGFPQNMQGPVKAAHHSRAGMVNTSVTTSQNMQHEDLRVSANNNSF